MTKIKNKKYQVQISMLGGTCLEIEAESAKDAEDAVYRLSTKKILKECDFKCGLQIHNIEIDEDYIDDNSLLAQSPDTSVEDLNILAKDENAEIRENVAYNSNTPPATLDILAKDENAGIRENVAFNSNTSPATLDILAKDENEDVRESVGYNPNTPPENLDMLDQDEESTNFQEGIANTLIKKVDKMAEINSKSRWSMRVVAVKIPKYSKST